MKVNIAVAQASKRIKEKRDLSAPQKTKHPFRPTATWPRVVNPAPRHNRTCQRRQLQPVGPLTFARPGDCQLSIWTTDFRADPLTTRPWRRRIILLSLSSTTPAFPTQPLSVARITPPGFLTASTKSFCEPCSSGRSVKTSSPSHTQAFACITFPSSSIWCPVRLKNHLPICHVTSLQCKQPVRFSPHGCPQAAPTTTHAVRLPFFPMVSRETTAGNLPLEQLAVLTDKYVLAPLHSVSPNTCLR